jgi:lipopolysaccharide exporter
MRYKQLANITLLASAVRVVATVVSALLHLSYWSFVIGDLLANIFLTWATWRLMEHRFRLRLEPKAKREVLTFSTGAIGNSMGYYVNYNSDSFIIGKVLGSASLGFYNLAYQLTNTLTNILLQALGDLGLSSFSQIKPEESQPTLLQVVRHTAFLAAPVYALISLLLEDEQVVRLVFGAKWIPICAVIPGLMFYAYCRLLNQALTAMLYSRGMTFVTARVNLMIAPIAVGGFLWAAKQNSIVYVSIVAAFVLGVVWTAWTWWAGCRALHWSLRPFLGAFVQPTLFALLSAVAVFPVPLLIRPFLFLGLYLLLVRLYAGEQFSTYTALIGKLSRRFRRTPNP